MGTVDAAEVGKFSAIAETWWDPDGPFRPLHALNPCRLDYVTRQIAAQSGKDLSVPRPFDGLRILDIGCGGGLISEPMARLGAEVVGADASEENIAVARVHAAERGLAIDYRATTAEALAESGARFDAVLALEIVEHVSDPAGFLRACGTLVKPGGLALLSTLNRTAKSFALAIVGAEWVLGWLPRGTHDWNRFLTPGELSGLCIAAGLAPVDRTGMTYAPLADRWSLSENDLSVNYLLTAERMNEDAAQTG